MRTGLLFPLLCLMFAFGAVSESFGQTKVPKTWALRPSDNADGQGFRLLFVTTTPRNATSTDIDVYNSFVQSAAANGHEAIRPYSEGFRVLGSVQGAISNSGGYAYDNTSTNPQTDGQGVPIYWLNGDKIVDNYADFWSSTRVSNAVYHHNHLWNSYVRTDEDGVKYTAHGFQRVLTGTQSIGITHGVVGFGGLVSVKTGRLNSDPSTWSSLGPIEYAPVPRARQYPFYGLSEVFVADLTNRAWVTVSALTLDEGASGTYTLALNTDPRADVTVTATSGEGSAVQLSTGGGTPGNSVTLTFTSGTGTWGAPQTVIVTAAEDTDGVSEQNVSIRHAVSVASGPYRSVSIPRVRVDVTDNDTVPVVAFSSASASVDEAAGTHTVTVSLDAALEADLTVAYSLSGAATQGDDYEIAGVTSGSGTVTVSGGATTADISVDITDDTVVEASETVVLTLTDDAGYTAGTTNVHTLTITDNDLPEVDFPVTSASVDESAGMRNVTVRLDQPPAVDITVAYNLYGAAARGNDYGISGVTGTSGTLDVSAGATTAAIPVSITDDEVVEGNEDIVLILSQGTGYTVGTANTYTLTVEDNDKLPEVVFASASANAGEASGMRNVTVNLDVPPAADISVAYSLSGAATRGEDYGISGVTGASGTLDVAAGATTAHIEVAITDDEVVEGSEAVRLMLTQGTGYTVGTANAHTLTITDNDAPGVTANPVVLNLDEGGADGSYTLVLDAEPSGTVTVTPSAGNSGAVALSGALTFDGSNWDAPQTVTVAPQDDADADDETVTITHAVAGYGSLTAGPEVTVGVNDDEEPATAGVDVSTLALSLSEGGAEGSYTVALRTDPGAAVTVTPSSADPGAVVVSGALSFDGSNWQAPQTVTVAPQDDADTDDETVMITHAVTGYAGVSSASSVQVRVADDDEPTPVASFASSSANAGEGSGARSVTVNFNPALASDVTLRYAVTGTATEGSDFSIANAGSVAVLAQASDATIPITITDDGIEESDETIVLTLQSGAGYEVGTPSTHTLVIADNDGGAVAGPEVTLSASPNPVAEGASVTITASLSQSLADGVTIPLVVAAGTAEAGDYSAPAPIVVAGNAPSGAGVIATVKDEDLDDETFTVSLGDLPGIVAAGSSSSVEITVTDTGGVTSIESPEEELPASFALEQNYPNPFNPSTTIAFSLDKAQHVTLAVYDLLGQEVRVLADGTRPAGRYRVTFDASDLASGTYVYMLQTEERVAIKTMVFLK